ncbi:MULTISPECIES: hypothetical protein [unclassified Modicisalibacter]|uniref:hypothetical protein n=1 Tax=unclassified Modicisalibacter TaxID=2679913 RepID=UPI001CCC709A|nr:MULTISPECIES: hypothetical protein [unclassified Modicisalibacter]MBZ9559077.1 hypothetical protein [Modicisalibacter sp. R2A 31.J]MBZ9576812.1 hypothetical protein [Modicisalibacter sp. MOD 31.J]
MKFTDLFTPKGRRAVGTLSLDLLKITGKVAVAGSAGLAGALASTAASAKPVNVDDADEVCASLKDGYRDGYEGYGYYSGGFKAD